MFVVFVPSKSSQIDLMLAGKASSLPLEWSIFQVLRLVGSSHNQEHDTRLGRLARDKHSSLLRTFVNYGSKNFITLGRDVNKN